MYAFKGDQNKNSNPGIEAELDIQYIMGIAPGIKTEFWEYKSMAFCKDLKNWTEALLADDHIALVHSVSYGWQGNLSKIGCKAEVVSAIDDDFAKLAARGITIVFASGDSGSGYTQPDHQAQCFHFKKFNRNQRIRGHVLHKRNVTAPATKAAKAEMASQCCQVSVSRGGVAFSLAPAVSRGKKKHRTLSALCTTFKNVTTTHNHAGYISKGLDIKTKVVPLYASWPASSPFVTAVGATRFYEDVVGHTEAAVSKEDQFGSGGGFSSMFAQPSWQAAAVKRYFAEVDPKTLPDETKATYNKTGRATPDVSALGTAYEVFESGKRLPGGVGGTSAAAPMFAGLVSLLNEARLHVGKKQLGFLNPFLYQNADALNDVTIGSDKIGRGGEKLDQGFNCTKGWDPVTGLGTPNFPKLLEAALALP